MSKLTISSFSSTGDSGAGERWYAGPARGGQPRTPRQPRVQGGKKKKNREIIIVVLWEAGARFGFYERLAVTGKSDLVGPPQSPPPVQEHARSTGSTLDASEREREGRKRWAQLKGPHKAYQIPFLPPPFPFIRHGTSPSSPLLARSLLCRLRTAQSEHRPVPHFFPSSSSSSQAAIQSLPFGRAGQVGLGVRG